MTTFPDLLAARLRRDPSRPFMTFYDDTTGERTELSVTTYANWVSKTANLLVEELMLDPGDDVRIDLPPHWLGAVFLGGLLSCGLHQDVDAPVAVVGPDDLAGSRGAGTVMACSLRPFATRFVEPLPDGVLDHGILWAGQSDVFSPDRPIDLGSPEPDDRRVITDLNPLSPGGSALLVSLLAGTGSMVLVVGSDDGQWTAHSQSERSTVAVRAGELTD
ncbi:MAG: TIGR03089 family protein [Propionibacteriales bacterium]|nr:TIGR03089 family protein [Propionibacteriales bacterium]